MEEKLIKMSAYIFMCNWETYDECIKKNLFGVSQNYVNDITEGDLCFLYQYDLKKLYGIWKSTSSVGWHDQAAWSGKYKNQVRVKLDSDQIREIHFSQVQHLLDHSGTLIFKLSGDKADLLRKAFDKDA